MTDDKTQTVRGDQKPMTRRGCLLGVMAWLLIMALPLCALVFAMRGEMGWQRGPFVEDRIWLVNLEGAPGQETASGLAYSATRLSAQPSARPTDICVKTSVYFLLWRGQSESLSYCECYQPNPAASGGYDPLGACP